mgnify:FL=1
MQEEAEQMIVVFTVSWTFVIALLIIAAAIGYGVLTFAAQHIVAISAFVWLPILGFIRKTWRDRTIPDEKKVGTTVKAILQLPTYAAMVQAVLSIVYEWVSGGLLGMVLFLIEMPVTLLVLAAVNLGAAYVLTLLYRKVLRAKPLILILAGIMAVLATGVIWLTNW